MKYSAKEIAALKEKVRNLQAILAGEKNEGRRRSLENEIRGLEATISGAYN